MNPSAKNHSPNTDADWCSAEREARRSLESARGSRDASLLDTALTQLREAWQARANAALEHMRDWALGAPGVLSMGVYSDGSYGIEKGLIYSFPVTCEGGDWKIVEGMELNAFSLERMRATEQELAEEMGAVAHLLPGA